MDDTTIKNGDKGKNMEFLKEILGEFESLVNSEESKTQRCDMMDKKEKEFIAEHVSKYAAENE